MPVKTGRFPGLTGNQLKMLALITMTCDHVGLQLFSRLEILRIIGRLALPIYAYMIAEGWHYTRDRKKYFLRLASLAAVCQAVYFAAMGSVYQCIMVTFSLSVCIIWLFDRALEEGTALWRVLAALGSAAAYFLCEVLPGLLRGTDFAIDYGFCGVMLPVLAYFGGNLREKVLLMGAELILLALDIGGVQWWALAALPLLALYNGKRGKWKIGTFFYLYYPLHLAAIYAISLFIM